MRSTYAPQQFNVLFAAQSRNITSWVEHRTYGCLFPTLLGTEYAESVEWKTKQQQNSAHDCRVCGKCCFSRPYIGELHDWIQAFHADRCTRFQLIFYWPRDHKPMVGILCPPNSAHIVYDATTTSGELLCSRSAYVALAVVVVVFDSLLSLFASSDRWHVYCMVVEVYGRSRNSTCFAYTTVARIECEWSCLRTRSVCVFPSREFLILISTCFHFIKVGVLERTWFNLPFGIANMAEWPQRQRGQRTKIAFRSNSLCECACGGGDATGSAAIFLRLLEFCHLID